MIRETDDRFAYFTPEKDREYLRAAVAMAQKARDEGNLPFGAVLVDRQGNILLEQPNIEVTERDYTGHAETALVRKASKAYTKDELWDCSLYTSCEPCCMCVGAIYWSNIGRVVYAISEQDLLQKTGDSEVNPTFDIGCRPILEKGQKAIIVRGPFAEMIEEASRPHEGYWD